MSTRRAGLALSVGALLLAGCAPTGAALPEGVSVAVTQLRSDVADRQVEVRVHNGGAEPVEIGAVALVDARFTAPATRVVERTSTLAPGGTVDVRVQLASVDCAAPTDAASSVELDWAQGDQAGQAVVAAPEVFPFLADLHARECVAERAADRAAIDFTDFTPSDYPLPATLGLSITPRPGDADLRITGIRETNLLTFDGATGGVRELDVTAADPAQVVSLPLVPARCDPHAVQEDKRGTVFTLEVVIDGDAGQFTLAAGADMRARILTWVSEWCAAE